MGEQLIVAILAAGASRRLGQPKQLVNIDGEPLLRRQCRVALDANIGPVAAILGCHAGDCAATISELPVVVHRNEQWSEGIASSIRAAAAMAIDMRARGMLILHGDQYRIDLEDLRKLYVAWIKAGCGSAIRSSHEGYTGPPVIFPSDTFSPLLELRGDEGARRVFPSLGRDVVDVEIPGAIYDLDLPKQLLELQQRTAATLSASYRAGQSARS